VPDLSADQRYIARMMFLGLLTAGGVIRLSWALSVRLPLLLTAGSPRETAVAVSVLLAALPLVALISRIAALRYAGTAIDGGRSDPVVELLQRVLQNTLEQTVLFALVLAALALTLPVDRLPLLILQSGAFCVYRLLFWLGYGRSPRLRAFGFATTFYSTIILMAVAGSRLLP
jgi:hypothetical protein